MDRNLFITATNTGIGKTVISALICKALLSRNEKVAYYKPIQTGSSQNISSDCAFLNSLFKDNDNFQSYSTYLFKEPASPHYASFIDNYSIEKAKIKSDYKRISKNNYYVVTEGAGGLYVPTDYSGNFIIGDIPRLMALNVVLVSKAGLGEINNVCLNSFFCKKKGIPLKVVILLYYGETPTNIELDNYKTIKEITKVEHIYLIKALQGVDTEENKTGDFHRYEFIDQREIVGWFL